MPTSTNLENIRTTICTTFTHTFRRCARNLTMRFSIGIGLVVALGAIVIGQGVDPAMLLKPPADSWPTYHGDYSGRRHSRLTQITPANVTQLSQAWKFDTGQNQ